VQEPSDPDEAREEEDAGSSLPGTAEAGTPTPVLPANASAIEAVGQRARLAEDRLAEVLSAYRQIKSDQEGQRERMTRALERRFEGRHERLLVKFIDVLDCFDRALEAAEQTYAGAPLIEGLILVRTQLLQTLRDEGLERIPVLGLPFDPHVSEAMGTEAVDDPDQHHVVVREYQRGYRFKERVVRPSRVVVGECPETPIAVALPTADVEVQAGAAPVFVDDRGPLRGPLPHGSDHAVSEEQRERPVLAVTPLTEEDGAPTIEEIVARTEANQRLRRDAFNSDGEASQCETSREEE
jgi:molecular chaperone GrpE